MQGWRLRTAAGIAVGAVWLLAVPLATAQENAAAAKTQAVAGDAQHGELQKLIDEREKGNQAAQASQKRIDDVSDQTDELLAKYRTAWKQIEATDAYNRQMQELIRSQEKELASLSDQLERVQSVSRSVTPLMIRMIDALDDFVKLDVPFLIDERTKRVKGLRDLMLRADVSTAEKFRQIMEAYQTENEYGRTIEAYRASLTIDGKEETVDFLRFGRIALVYQSLDEQQRGVWSQKERKWVPLDSGYRSAIRQGLRIARKQSAPDLVRLPLPAPTNATNATNAGEAS